MATALQASVHNALSMDARLAATFHEQPYGGRVHSVFSRVVNVLGLDGRLLTLAAEGLDDAPWTIRVGVKDWCPLGIEAGSAVVLDPRQATLVGEPGVVVDLRGVQKWYSSQRMEGIADAAALTHRAAVLERELERLAVPGGIVACPARKSAVDAEIGRRLVAEGASLIAALRTKADGAARHAARGLLGLGLGLTPAGDDFMVGLALAAAVPGSRLGHFTPILRAVLEEHPDATTLVSRTTLEEAIEGRARESLLGLVDCVFGADDGAETLFAEHLRVPMERVLSIGHTSGTDILSGLVAGLRLEIELRGSM